MTDNHSETENSQPDKELIQSAFEQLWGQVRKQDDLIHSWTQFYMYIQAGLGVALAFLLKLSPSQSILANGGNLIIPVLGMTTAFFLTRIIMREHFWQGRYMWRIRQLPGMPEIIQQNWVPSEPQECKRGYISNQLWWLRIVLMGGWALVALLSLSRITAGLQL